MKLKEYMDKREAGAEVTCWDNVIDSEFYFYKKNVGEKPDPEFINVNKLDMFLQEHLEVKAIKETGVEVDLYKMLNHPFVIEYAKEHFYESYQYECDEDVVLLLFDDAVLNITHGYENFSGLLLDCLTRKENGVFLSDMELVQGNVMVEWVELGEGLHGDFVPDDKDDVELLRFDVSVAKDGSWVQKEDGSYCTRFPADASSEEKRRGLMLLMSRIYDVLGNDIDASIKKLGEELSHISLEDVQKEKKTFKIPVMYEVWGTVDVEARNLKEALEKAEENLEILPLPEEPEYVDGTYEIDYEGIELNNELTSEDMIYIDSRIVKEDLLLEKYEKLFDIGPFSEEQKKAFNLYVKEHPEWNPGEILFVKDKWESFLEYVEKNILNDKEIKYFEIYVTLGSIETGGYSVYVKGVNSAEEAQRKVCIESGKIEFIVEIDEITYKKGIEQMEKRASLSLDEKIAEAVSYEIIPSKNIDFSRETRD